MLIENIFEVRNRDDCLSSQLRLGYIPIRNLYLFKYLPRGLDHLRRAIVRTRKYLAIAIRDYGKFRKAFRVSEFRKYVNITARGVSLPGNIFTYDYDRPYKRDKREDNHITLLYLYWVCETTVESSCPTNLTSFIPSKC